MEANIKIETERLYLYPISNADMARIVEYEKDPEMKQAYGQMLKGCLDNPDNRIWNAIWLMELKTKRGLIVGDFSFKGLGADGMVEIGYGLRDGFCGNGYMAEAVSKITKWALMQEGVKRVEAETDPDNLKSAAVLSKAGYVPLGIMGEEGPRYIFKASEV